MTIHKRKHDRHTLYKGADHSPAELGLKLNIEELDFIETQSAAKTAR